MGSTGREPEVTRANFPDGFVFGVATSAYQVGTAPGRRRPHLIPRGRLRLASVPPRACALRTPEECAPACARWLGLLGGFSSEFRIGVWIPLFGMCFHRSSQL
jgi:hypothetical protein